MRSCHLRDGAAVVEFLAWLEEHLCDKGAGGANTNTISEVEIDERLTNSRASMSGSSSSGGGGRENVKNNVNIFIGPSFATIAGVNENAATIHYR